MSLFSEKHLGESHLDAFDAKLFLAVPSEESFQFAAGENGIRIHVRVRGLRGGVINYVIVIED